MNDITRYVIGVAAAGACALAFAACSAPAKIYSGVRDVSFTVEKVVELSRGPCFGFCPSYRVTLYEDGTLQYEGDTHVKTHGPAWTVVSSAVVEEVRFEFETTGFKLLAKDCCDCTDWTDMPTVTLRYTAPNTQAYEIRHYHGCGAAPQWLTQLENRIDELLHTERFIGTESERDSVAAGGGE